MNLKHVVVGLFFISVFGCGALKSLDEPSSATLVRSSLVGTAWSTCINVGVSQSIQGVVHFSTTTDSTFNIYTYTNLDCAGSPKYYGGSMPDNYVYNVESVNTACIPDGPTLSMNQLGSGDTQAVRFVSSSVMHLAEGSPAPGCDNPNFLTDFTNPTIFNFTTQTPTNPPMPSTLAHDVWYTCNNDVNGDGYSIGKVYTFDGNGTTADITEYYFPATSCDGNPTGILSDSNVIYEWTLTGSNPEACLKITDGGNDTFTPVTFPDAPSYSYLQIGDSSAGPGCGTTFNSGYNLNLLIGSLDIPSGLQTCELTPVNTCP